MAEAMELLWGWVSIWICLRDRRQELGVCTRCNFTSNMAIHISPCSIYHHISSHHISSSSSVLQYHSVNSIKSRNQIWPRQNLREREREREQDGPSHDIGGTEGRERTVTCLKPPRLSATNKSGSIFFPRVLNGFNLTWVNLPAERCPGLQLGSRKWKNSPSGASRSVAQSPPETLGRDLNINEVRKWCDNVSWKSSWPKKKWIVNIIISYNISVHSTGYTWNKHQCYCSAHADIL